MTQIATIDNNKVSQVKHGIFSSAVLLPWESREEYQKVVENFIQDFAPTGGLQEQLVEELIEVVWRKFRLIKARNSNHYKRQHYILADSYSDSNSLRAALTLVETSGISDTKEKTLWLLRLGDAEAEKLLKQYQTDLGNIKKLLAKELNYEKMLEKLDEDAQYMWKEALEDSSYYKPEKASLVNFARYTIIQDYQNYITILSNRQQIKNVVEGDIYTPDETAMRLLNYEQFLDRKYEKTLAMLLKLKEVGGNSNTPS